MIELEKARKQSFRRMIEIKFLVLVAILLPLMILAAITSAANGQLQAGTETCTVFYHAGIVVCDQPAPPTATATPISEATPAREKQSVGYPAPGDPAPTETAIMPYPPPISGDPDETQPPIPTPDFEATYQADLCLHAGLCTPTPTRTPRPTPTLAPTITAAP